MRPDPLSLAREAISETRAALAGLILSSETFNSPQAKRALRELEAQIRRLAKLEARLAHGGESNRAPNICTVDFGKNP